MPFIVACQGCHSRDHIVFCFFLRKMVWEGMREREGCYETWSYHKTIMHIYTVRIGCSAQDIDTMLLYRGRWTRRQ